MAKIKIIIFSGGIGGAKLIEGFYYLINRENLTNQIDLNIVVNTGDDFLWYGLLICPDIDIIIYTLKNIVDRNKGWGIDNDSFNCLNFIKNFYDDSLSWFNLGDKDLAISIYRSFLLNKGQNLSKIVKIITEKFNLKINIYPMAENYMPTMLETDLGILHFQEYLVKHKAQPIIKRIIYGADSLIQNNEQVLIPQNLESLMKDVDIIIIGPSNPLLSINPILHIPFYNKILKEYKNQFKNIIAISPLILSKAVKGPLVKNLIDLGYEPNNKSIAEIYCQFITTFLIDERDGLLDYCENLSKKYNIKFLTTNILMDSIEKKIELAKFILNLYI